MATNILMPALSPTMEQGKLAKWLKKEGDAVRSGDVIAEIETDKATMEVEAIDDGTLAKILVPDGTDNVAVNTPIAVIAAEGEDVGSVKAPAAAAPARGSANGAVIACPFGLRLSLGRQRPPAGSPKDARGTCVRTSGIRGSAVHVSQSLRQTGAVC